jgi:PPOX class probable F420-dependent enzyme
MEVPESHRDLAEAPYATLATIDRDGYPQLTEVVFLYDDDGKFKVSLNDSRHKTRNLTARPQASLFILDLEKPGRYLEVRGKASLEPDTDSAFVLKVGEKYGGADFREHDLPGQQRMIVTIDPVRVHAVDITGG